MNEQLKSYPRIEFQVHLATGSHGRKRLKKGARARAPQSLDQDLPRLTRLLALAHRWDRLISEGVVANRAEIAKIMGLSRARVTQIMDLLYLAPEIQEEILLYQDEGQQILDVPERAIRHITRIPSWFEQRDLWRRSRMAGSRGFHHGPGISASPSSEAEDTTAIRSAIRRNTKYLLNEESRYEG